MMVHEYEEQLGTYELQRKQLISELDDISDRLQDKCIPFLQSKIKEVVESDVKNHPDITKSLTKDQLSEIRDEMNTAIANVESKLAEAFAARRYYESIRPEIDCMYEFNMSGNVRKHFISIMEGVLNSINKVLVKYKYEYGAKQTISMLGKEISEDITTYGSKCVEYLKLIININDCSKKKAEQEAEDIWNQIQ